MRTAGSVPREWKVPGCQSPTHCAEWAGRQACQPRGRKHEVWPGTCTTPRPGRPSGGPGVPGRRGCDTDRSPPADRESCLPDVGAAGQPSPAVTGKCALGTPTPCRREGQERLLAGQRGPSPAGSPNTSGESGSRRPAPCRGRVTRTSPGASRTSLAVSGHLGRSCVRGRWVLPLDTTISRGRVLATSEPCGPHPPPMDSVWGSPQPVADKQ